MKVLVLFSLCVFCSLSLSAQKVDAGNGHALILDEDNTILTVGRNDHGQLGTGDYENKDVPVSLGIENVAIISRGYDHSMCIDESGALWGWGNNRFGQLNIEKEGDILKPRKVELPFKLTHCEGGYDHSVFIDEFGHVWAVGFNEHGELGNGSKLNSSKMVPVQFENGEQLKNIQDIVSVGSHTLALDSVGDVFSWGANYYGELGHFKSAEQAYADKIEGLQDITSIAVGWGHSIALNKKGEVYAWGAKPETYGGTTGEKTTYYSAIEKLNTLPEIKSIASGSWHSMAIDEEGFVWSWGWNQYGMLGDGTTEHSGDPVKMKGIENATSIGGGCFQSIVVDSDGQIFACGDNKFGQLGIANDDRKLSLAQVEVKASEPNMTHFIFVAIFFSLLMAFGTGVTLFYRLKNER